MKLHANARTCPNSRRLLVKRIEEQGWPPARAAMAAGISERTARKWLARWRSEGERGLLDRSSSAKSRPTQLPDSRVRAIEALRRLRMTAAEIAGCLQMALSTVSRWLRRIGLGKLSRLEPPEPPNRYERKRPGELVHVDVKRLGRIQGGAGKRWRAIPRQHFRAAHRDAAGVKRRTIGWEFCHVCVDDATRLAYVEVLADERGETAAGFLRRAVAWFRSMGVRVERVMSDNGACYRSTVHAIACRELGIRHLRTQPTAHGPTARPSASSRPCEIVGPGEPSTAPPPSGPRRYPAGSITTTSVDDMAPSATSRPQLGSPSWNNVMSSYS